MKCFPITLAVVLLMLSLGRGSAQDLRQPPLISVSGSADVKIPPDEVYLRVGIETRHESLEEAQRQNDQRYSKTMISLKNKGVEEKNIQSDFVNIEPEYDNDVSRTKPVIFVVRKSMEIKLTKIEGFEGVIIGLLTSGITHIHGIEFRTSQLRKHRDTARAMAIRAAKEKADALARELGIKAGKVYSVSANDWGGFWNFSDGISWGGRGGGIPSQNVLQGKSSEIADGTISIGQVSVSATVSVSFLIE